jgi:hypothetical protein
MQLLIQCTPLTRCDRIQHTHIHSYRELDAYKILICTMETYEDEIKLKRLQPFTCFQNEFFQPEAEKKEIIMMLHDNHFTLLRPNENNEDRVNIATILVI